MTTNQTIDGVPRAALEILLSGKGGLAQAAAAHELRALLDAPAEQFNPNGWSIDSSAGRPILVHNNCSVIEAEQAYGLMDLIKAAAQPQGEPVAKNKPVAKLHAERLTGRDGEYGVTVEDSQWFNTCRLTGGIFNLYAEPPATVAAEKGERYVDQPAPEGTTSDKYRSELYDEVWQKARDLGFSSVTEALRAVAVPQKYDDTLFPFLTMAREQELIKQLTALNEAVAPIVADFQEYDRMRYEPVQDTFKHPANGKTVENGVTVKVRHLRALSELVGVPGRA